MKDKKIFLKKVLSRVANSKIGPFIYEKFRGITELLSQDVLRGYVELMTTNLAVSNLINQPYHDDQPYHDARVRHLTNVEDNLIKIRFFHYNSATFNVIQTVCESFKNDQRFDVLIVLFGNSYSSMIEQMKEQQYNYVEEFNYDIEKDRPDISVIYNLEAIYPPQLTKIRVMSRFVALVPLAIGSIWFGERTIRRMHLDKFNADMCCVGNLCYERLREPIGINRVDRISPAQFDLAYRKFQKPTHYPYGWEKLKGKKTVMLMTDHGIRMTGISDEVTLDLYLKTLMEYCRNYPDFGFIIRFHFALIRELVTSFWSLTDYNQFIEYCKNSPNIVWDDSDDYLDGLHIADACLIDVNCSLVYFALAANKPIGIPLRYDMPVVVNNPELLEKYYNIDSQKSLIEFLDMIRTGKDPKIKSRQEAFNQFIETFDGRNGERIYKRITERYLEKYPCINIQSASMNNSPA